MDVDVWVRRIALAAIPLVGVAIYFLRSDPPAATDDGAAPSASAPATHDGIPSSTESGPSGAELGARGEAALAMPKPPPADPVLPPKPKKRAPRSRSASDLPLAEDLGAVREDRSAPRGPCGGIEARLITVSDDAEWTFASLAPPGEPASIRHVGDRVGSWRLEKIEWDRVWLRAGGTRCAVGMHVGARAGADEVGGGSENSLDESAPRRAAIWAVPREIENAIERVANGRFAVERGVVGGLFERAGELLHGIQVTPARRNEVVTGITLSEVKQGSLLDHFGVESGDTLLAINGKPTTSLEGTLEALADARKKERLLARLDRVGGGFELEIVSK